MPIELAVILGVVQGLTEFFPVSSSGHLVLFQYFCEPFFRADKTPLAFSVFVHLATFVVTAVYMRREIACVLVGLLKSGPERESGFRMVWLVVLGTAPAAFVVLLARNFVEESFVGLGFAAKGFLITAILLELAHQRLKNQAAASPSVTNADWQKPTSSQAVIIGLFQALAIFPGVSRSGATIAAALLVGLGAESAIRFSFWLFLPAVLGAAVLESAYLVTLSFADMAAYSSGFVITCVVGWMAILGLIKVVRTDRLRGFALYTLLLGAALHLAF